MIRAVFFDLGNTLLNKYVLVETELELPFWKKHGYKGNLKEFKKAKEIIKDKLFKENKKENWIVLIAKYLGITPSKEILGEYYKLVKDYYVRKAQLRKGAFDLLEYLKSEDIKMILVSNNLSDIANEIIDSLDIRKYFDSVIISDRIGAIKSDLKPFVIALKKVKVDPKECMMVGDSKEDMCCKKLGIIFVWFNSTNRLLIDCNYRIKELSEIKDIIYNHYYAI